MWFDCREQPYTIVYLNRSSYHVSPEFALHSSHVRPVELCTVLKSSDGAFHRLLDVGSAETGCSAVPRVVVFL